jgi:TonB family protein
MPYLSAPTKMGLKRDPSLAYNMSLVMPGLGQLYNKEKRKAGIFLIAGGINYAILIMLIFAPAILENVKSFGQAYNIKLNSALVGALLQMQFGSGASLALLALFMLFAIFSAADARDRALYIERKAIYIDQAMALPEAAGGSYIFHMSMLVACVILAFFFLIPAPPREQVTEFEFKQVEESKEKVVSKVRANSNSQGARHNDKMPTAVAKSSSSSSSSSRSSVSPPVSRPAPRASEPRPVSEPLLKPAFKPVFRPVFKPVFKPTTVTDSAVPLPAVKPNVVARLPQTPSLPVTAPATQPQQIPAPAQPLLALAPTPFKFQPRPVTVSGGQANPQPRMPVAAATAGLGQSAAPHPVAVSTSSGQSSNDSGSGPTPVSVARTSAANSGGPAPVAARSPAGQGLALAPNVRPTGRDSGNGSVLQPGANGSKSTTGKGGDDNAHNPARGIGAGSGPAQGEPDFGPYMADLQRRIKRAWFPPHVGRSKRIKVVFKVASDGRLVHLRMATSSGLEIADQAALKAVENAAPFRPLPPNAPAEVDIEFTFDYNVFNGGGSGTFKNF